MTTRRRPRREAIPWADLVARELTHCERRAREAAAAPSQPRHAIELADAAIVQVQHARAALTRTPGAAKPMYHAIIAAALVQAGAQADARSVRRARQRGAATANTTRREDAAHWRARCRQIAATLGAGLRQQRARARLVRVHLLAIEPPDDVPAEATIRRYLTEK